VDERELREGFVLLPLEAATELILEFDHSPSDAETREEDMAKGVLIHQLKDLLGSIDAVIRDLHSIHGIANDSTLFYGAANVEVVFIEKHSPVKIGLGISKIPKDVVRAFLSLCESLLFRREERSRREALAADAWEEVRAKRLKNIKTAIQIASGNRPHNELLVRQMDTLLEDAMELERVPFTVKSVGVGLRKTEDKS
jgi:hypothetical protein